MYKSVDCNIGCLAGARLRRYLRAGFPMALAASLWLLAAGCSTSIQLTVQRPPVLNTAGINRIAVMPFESDGGDRNYDEAAKYAATVVANKIRETNHFTLVDPSEVERLRRGGQSIESVVDATFVGRLTQVQVENTTKEWSRKDKDGNIVNGVYYITTVDIEFNYSLIRARDGSLIGPISKNSRDQASNDNNYPPAAPLIRKLLDGELASVGRDLAPYTTVEERVFAEADMPNDTLKANMKNALMLVKAGNYKQALEAYRQIYEKYTSVAAAENMSILYESFGNIQSAAGIMQEAYDATGNPKAMAVLNRLNGIIKDQNTLAADYGDKKSLTEKASFSASEEIRKFLPQGAKVLIYNTTPNNEKAAVVLDNITADFIKAGISVVDRDQLSAALIQEELMTQMSGNVSDDDIVKIGNAAGANTIVMLGVEGSGAMRRLRVKVLDVEKQSPLMQSDSGEMWRL